MGRNLRADIREIFDAGVRAADPRKAILKSCAWNAAHDRFVIGERTYDLHGRRILIAGIGKAACPMAAAMEDLLGSRIEKGLVITKDGHTVPLKRIEIREAAHPVPDERGMQASEDLLALIRDAGEDDVIIFLISGGGSSLMILPSPGISLGDTQAVTKILLESGATIKEINVIRKHLSRIKGGQFARTVYPATLLSLVISDVIDDELDVIASGPAVPDGSTFADCVFILNKYRIMEKIPASVRERLEKGAKGDIEETPKQGDCVFTNVSTHVVGTSGLSLQAARDAAVSRGYNAMILSSCIKGETREVAVVHAAILREVKMSGNPITAPACIISGGETTVTVRGPGLGGRNMEFVLAAALEIEGIDNVAVLSGATDGTDGPTGAAGAIADGMTIPHAAVNGINASAFLEKNDSYHFFSETGDLLITGSTMTNVMDLRILLIA